MSSINPNRSVPGPGGSPAANAGVAQGIASRGTTVSSSSLQGAAVGAGTSSPAPMTTSATGSLGLPAAAASPAVATRAAEGVGVGVGVGTGTAGAAGDGWTAPAGTASPPGRLAVPSTSVLPDVGSMLSETGDVADAKLTAQIRRLASDPTSFDSTPLTPAQRAVIQAAERAVAQQNQSAPEPERLEPTPKDPRAAREVLDTMSRRRAMPIEAQGAAGSGLSDLARRLTAAARGDVNAAQDPQAAQLAAALAAAFDPLGAEARAQLELLPTMLRLPDVSSDPRSPGSLGQAAPKSEEEAAVAARASTLAESSLRGGGGAAGGLGSIGRGAVGEAAEQLLLQIGVQQRQLAVLIAAMPPSLGLQPVLAFLAADLFRLQSARLELMAGLRVADDDGEMPPLDEDEATMRRRRVPGVGGSDMWRFDRMPASEGQAAAAEDSLERPALAAAVVAGALQAPQRVLPIFQQTSQHRIVRLYRPSARAQWAPVWVQLPADPDATGLGPSAQALAEAPPRAAAHRSVQMTDLAAWLGDVQRAAAALEQACTPPRPEHLPDQTSLALAQLTGQRVWQWPPDDAPANSLQAWRMLCRSNSPKAALTLLLTLPQLPDDGPLRAEAPYGVVGVGHVDGRAQVVLCEVAARIEAPWRLIRLTLPEVLSATWTLCQVQ